MELLRCLLAGNIFIEKVVVDFTNGKLHNVQLLKKLGIDKLKSKNFFPIVNLFRRHISRIT
jgi:hypothetical protein